MSLFPCTGCGLRKPGKLANVTMAWWTAANKRVAWRLRLCTGCYADQILPIDANPDAESLACPLCHTGTDDDMDPVYLTIFIPDVGRQQLELPTCAACAARLRIWGQEHGAKLEDASGGQDPGPQTGAQPASDWATLGLRPRA